MGAGLVAQSASAGVPAEVRTQGALDYFAARSAELVAFSAHCRSLLDQVPCVAAVELECKMVPALASAQAFEQSVDLPARSAAHLESD